MRATSVLLISAVLLGFGCDKKSDQADKAKETKDTGNKDEAKPPDYHNLAIKKVEDAVDGIAFSIDLPAGLVREVKKGDDTLGGYVTWSAKNPFGETPTYTVQAVDSLPDSLESAVTMGQPMNPHDVVQKHQVDGGFMVSYVEKSRSFIEVAAWRKAPSGKTIKCYSLVRTTKPIQDKLGVLREFMEKVVMSCKPKQ